MSGQSVIVTAGASGIGLAIARSFLEAGARVAICDLNAEALAQVKAEHPDIQTLQADIAREDQAIASVAEVVRLHGRVDVLVNNAGIAGACAPIADISAVDWIRSFDVNVHGVFFMLRAALPDMIARRTGAIINISTGSVFTLPAGRADYVASKWALEGLTRAAAKELGPLGIRVNAIRPGFVDSARMRGILGQKAKAEDTTMEALEQRFLDYISMRTKVQPEDIARMAVFLASESARFVTGQLVSVDGNIEWEN
ncbi:SDR family oxidoreductase [Paracoccus kondratievae]|uniref:SDR family oxidoreductase n=1 Tax=Paracoccus kondratievae TaxID=135740 RepID=UPI0012663643|nr:SDR family oxidoreductase [Paracoccus kondratievae]QFQ89104.1 SDR family oxidoreductase [Paracoccus kondratievae]